MKGFGFDLKQSGGYVGGGRRGGLSVIELGLSAMTSVFH